VKKFLAGLGRKKADKKAAEPSADAPRAIRQSTGLSSVSLGIVAFLLSAAVLAVAGGFAYLQYTAKAEQAGVAAAHANARGIAGEVAARVAVYADVIAQAAARPGVAEATAANDAVALQEEAARLRESLPGVLRVRFIRPDDNTPDESAKPALGYACLDLAHRASGKAPAAEVHLFGGPDQHVDIARAIPGQGAAVAGALLVSLDVKVLKRWLKPGVPADAYAELRQGASGARHLLLASRGNASLQGREVRYQSPVAGTLWRIAFWPAPGGGLSGGERTGFLAVFGAALAALAVLFALFTFALRRLLQGDLVKLVHLIDELWRGKRQHSFTVRLAEVKRVADALEHQVDRVRRSPPKKRPSPPPEAPGAGLEVSEEAPMPGVMFIDRAAVSVEESEGEQEWPASNPGEDGNASKES
jgi:HAMP domain-containing protein